MNIDKKIEKIVDDIEGGEAYGDPIVKYKGQDNKELLTKDIKQLALEVQKETAREMVAHVSESCTEGDPFELMYAHQDPAEFVEGAYKQITGEDYE